MNRWHPEEMLLRRKISSFLEVTGSQTSGYHGVSAVTHCLWAEQGQRQEVGQWLGYLGLALVSIPGPPWVFRRKCMKGQGKQLLTSRLRVGLLLAQGAGASHASHPPQPTWCGPELGA